MAKLASALKALKGDLSKLGIKNARVMSYPALPAKKIESLEKKHKCRLPDEVKAYYQQANGQTIAWSTSDGGAVGRSSILSLEELLASRPFAGSERRRLVTPFHSRYLSETEKQLLEGYWVFERMYADSFILVPADAKSGQTPVFLLQHPSKLTKLDLSFSEYLDQLIENRALLNWQEVHKQEDRDPDLVASFNRSVAVLRGLTAKAPPPVRESAFQSRLDRLVAMVKGNQKLELLELKTYPAPPMNAIKKIEATFGQKLPASMIEFYSQLNGFKLRWRTKPDTTPAAAGVIDLLPLEEAFGGEHHATTVDWDEYVTYQTLWNDELMRSAPEDFRALKDKRVFDRHLLRNQVLTQVGAKGVRFSYFVDGGVLELNATFEELIELIFGCGGLEYYPDLLRKDAPDGNFRLDFEEKARVLNPQFRRPA